MAVMDRAPVGHADGLLETSVEFMRLRPRLLGIAYRVVGDMAEAEDIVQEVWVRWQCTDRSQVRAPAAFLTRVTVHLAINVTQSARSRREVVGDCSEPVPADADAGPPAEAEQAEALGLALHLLLQKLSPVERAAFVLREAFDYPYSRIAGMLELSQPNARQVVSRARRRLHVERNAPVDGTEHQHLLSAFLAAAQSGRVTALECVLTNGADRHRSHPGVPELPASPGPAPERRVSSGAGTGP